MIGRERGDNGKTRQSVSQRQHGLDALAGRHDIGRPAEADAVSEQMTHRAPWGVDRRLVVAGRVEPGAMRTGDIAAEISDGGDQGWPDLGRRVGIRPVIAARVETQGCGILQGRDAALAQIWDGTSAATLASMARNADGDAARSRRT
jgi:hypothetical protein